jgi:hypothetical protein
MALFLNWAFCFGFVAGGSVPFCVGPGFPTANLGSVGYL